MKAILSILNGAWLMMGIVCLVILLKSPHILIEIFGPGIAFVLVVGAIHYGLWKYNNKQQEPTGG